MSSPIVRLHWLHLKAATSEALPLSLFPRSVRNPPNLLPEARRWSTLNPKPRGKSDFYQAPFDGIANQSSHVVNIEPGH